MTTKKTTKKVAKKTVKKTPVKVEKVIVEPVVEVKTEETKVSTSKPVEDDAIEVKETFEDWWAKNNKSHIDMISLLLKHFKRAYRVDTLRMKYGMSLDHKQLAEKVWEEFNENV